MFPSSSSSHSQPSTMPNGTTTTPLSRTSSASASILNRTLDSLPINNTNFHDFSPFVSPPDFNHQQQQQHQNQNQPEYHKYFSRADISTNSSATESNSKVNNLNHHPASDHHHSETSNKRTALQRSGVSGINDYNIDDYSIASKAGSSSPALIRHSSSPAGFLNQLTADMGSGGFSVPRGSENYSRGNSSNGPGTSRLKPQLSFTRQDLNMSQLSGITENAIEGLDHNNGHRETHNYAYANDSWDNGASITFSGPPSKRNKNEDEYLNCFSGLEHQFSLPQTTLEMATVEKLLHIPEDSAPCKIRAKRGFATHPRSIAERERRTRISGKLKKLQDLVPNMDKQTSYADMLDLAVQHIKGLQNQVQKLNKDMENCTCGCNKPTS